MIRDLINISLEEIDNSAIESVSSTNTVVMYLQNNGNKINKLNDKDIDVWLYEDIDD